MKKRKRMIIKATHKRRANIMKDILFKSLLVNVKLYQNNEADKMVIAASLFSISISFDLDMFTFHRLFEDLSNEIACIFEGFKKGTSMEYSRVGIVLNSACWLGETYIRALAGNEVKTTDSLEVNTI